MKKISVLVLSISALITYISCEPEQTPEDNPTPSEVDAAAQSSYFDGCVDPSGMNVDICETQAAAYGQEASSQYSQQGGGGASRSTNGLLKLKETEILLPEKYMVVENPYEAQGVAHNRVLFYMINAKRKKEDKEILFNNEKTLTDVAAILASSFKKEGKQISAVRNSLTSFFNPAVLDQITSKYKNVTYSSLFKDSKMSGTSIEFCKGLAYEVYLVKKNESSDKIGVIMNLINKKISHLLTIDDNKDKDKRGKLVFLTVYKHSYYYWNN